jgi:glycosidase
MLHFLENHDEQRIASKQFAGDMWKAAPAMTISATIDKGPLMIYFGQEVGEKGVGDEGFQGEDGRTTIFDYWGVPAHQAWMNNGKFDGISLTMEQKQLRMFYKDILTLASKSKAIANGNYIDLTAYNIDKDNFSNQIHVFVRYTEDEKLLVVSGFNSQPEDIQIEIPKAVIAKMGLDPDKLYFARDLIWKEVEVGLSENFSFELKMKPYSCFIFKIK